jgi:hypothetical protein
LRADASVASQFKRSPARNYIWGCRLTRVICCGCFTEEPSPFEALQGAQGARETVCDVLEVIDKGFVSDSHPVPLLFVHGKPGFVSATNRRRAGSSLRRGAPRWTRPQVQEPASSPTEGPPHRNDTNPPPEHRLAQVHSQLRRAVNPWSGSRCGRRFRRAPVRGRTTNHPQRRIRGRTSARRPADND